MTGSEVVKFFFSRVGVFGKEFGFEFFESGGDVAVRRGVSCDMTVGDRNGKGR